MRKKSVYISIAAIVIVLGIVSVALSFRRCSDNDGTPVDAHVIDTIPMVLTQIRNCSQLHTAEVVVHKVITHDDQLQLSGKFMGKDISLNIPAGKRKVAIPMFATVKASIDLTKITENDIIRHGNKIEIILPSPVVTITETHIDHEGIRQYVSLTRRNFSDEELQTYERKGREAIVKDLPRLGIEPLARESAARQLIPIVEMTGYEEKDIIITFRNNDENNTIYRKDR